MKFHNEVNQIRRATEMVDKICQCLLRYIVGFEDLGDILQNGLGVGRHQLLCFFSLGSV